MSLTNPNKVITEERLSAFYQDILPYLGGMPEILANKFSRSDIYSTTEKIIGVWEDSKPLYQKTFVITNVTDWSAISLGLENIDMITKKDSCYGILSNGDLIGEHGFFESASSKSYFTVMVYKTSNNQPNVYIAESASGSLTKVVITVLYTKTTDSAISIGSDTDYSTTEKIVGTWIDGSPVWQKTVSTGGSVPTGATLILRTAMASTGYDTILYTKTS